MGSAQLQIVSLLSYVFVDIVPDCRSGTLSWRYNEGLSECIKNDVLAVVVENVIPEWTDVNTETLSLTVPDIQRSR
jgi:hypothetical protein